MRKWMLLLVLLAGNAHAAEQRKPPDWTSTEVSKLCTAGQVADAISFPAIRANALEVRRKLCVEKASRSDVERAFVQFISDLAQTEWFAGFGGFEGARNPFEAVRSGIDLGKGKYPTLTTSLNDQPALVQSDAGLGFPPADVAKCDKSAGKNSDGSGRSCRDVLDEVRGDFEYARFTLEAKRTLEFEDQVTSLGNQWDEFLFHSRSETILELAINSAIYRRHETRQFGPPPDRQLIVLHPDIVIENVSAAVSGSKSKDALMIEVIGANWWRQERWYVPTGASLVALYADRAKVRDMGYGVALHFRSVYTLGVTNHGGSNGVFISVDLLKFLQDKKKTLDKYTR